MSYQDVCQVKMQQGQTFDEMLGSRLSGDNICFFIWVYFHFVSKVHYIAQTKCSTLFRQYILSVVVRDGKPNRALNEF